jgi:hypothetical protein
MSWQTSFRDQTRPCYKLAIFGNFVIDLVMFLTILLADPTSLLYAMTVVGPLALALFALCFLITFLCLVEYVNKHYSNKIEKAVLALSIGFGGLPFLFIMVTLLGWRK